MKQMFKTMGILQICVLYCFVMLLNSGPAFNSEFEKTNYASTTRSGFNTEVGLNGLLHTENNIGNHNTLTPTCVKYCGNKIIKALSKQEQRASYCLSIYQFFSKNNLLRTERRDIIFPFHYFW